MDVGVIWSLVITGLGVVVAIVFGVWGVIAGRAGQKRAEEAERLARTLNRRVTDMGGDIAGIREVSIDARNLAEDANSTRDRQLKALTEEHVVTWRHEWKGYGVYHVEHTGRHDALNVRFIVFVDRQKQVVERERVEPGETIDLEYPEALIKEEASDVKRDRMERAPSNPLVPRIFIPEQFTTLFEVHWNSSAGVQHSYGPKETTESY